MIDIGHWKTKEPMKQLPYGFIYRITNIATGRKYIGKKQCFTTKKLPPLKGKKNKRHQEVETDFRTYCSSCKELQADIEKLGNEKFLFEIVECCSCKWELAYNEARLQFENRVLLSNDWYNGIINLRIPKRKI